MGTNATALGLYPTFLMKLEVSLTISLKRSSLHYQKCEISGREKDEEDIHLSCVHLVDGDDELPDTEGECKEGVLAGLAILGDASLELTSAASNDEDGAIGLGRASDHVLDEITVTRCIDDLHGGVTRAKTCMKQKRKHTVTMNFGVSNFQRAISMVIPRSRSAFSLSRTHAAIW